MQELEHILFVGFHDVMILTSFLWMVVCILGMGGVYSVRIWEVKSCAELNLVT